MLLDIAIADAYGAGFEFAKPEVLEKRPNDFTRYFRHNLDDNLPGMYTDDTQMSLGLARWLLSVNSLTLAQTQSRDIAWFFVDTFQRDPRQAYSRRMFKFLKSHPNVDDFLGAIDASSTRSGSAMRSAVLGVLPTLGDVVRIATLQAKITHDTAQGIACSVAVASAAWYVRNGKNVHDAIALAGIEACNAASACVGRVSPQEAETFLSEQKAAWQAMNVTQRPLSPVGYYGMPCVHAAFYAVLHHWDDPIEMLKAIVSYAGDTDTVAAIAMGIRSMAPGPPIEWPAWCRTTLEQGEWGLDYLVGIDQQLAAAWPVVRPD